MKLLSENHLLQVEPSDFHKIDPYTYDLAIVMIVGGGVACWIAGYSQPNFPVSGRAKTNTIGEAMLVFIIGMTLAGLLWIFIKQVFKLQF